MLALLALVFVGGIGVLLFVLAYRVMYMAF